MLTQSDKIEILELIKESFKNYGFIGLSAPPSTDPKVNVERQIIRSNLQKQIFLLEDKIGRTPEDNAEIDRLNHELDIAPTVSANKAIQSCLDLFDFEYALKCANSLGYKYNDASITLSRLVKDAIDSLHACESCDMPICYQYGRLVASKFYDEDVKDYYYTLSFIIERVESDAGE